MKISTNATTRLETLPRSIGIKLLKKVKKDTDYVYRHGSNEMVERFKLLLLASREAGNNGENNVIVAIIAEIREAGIINTEYNKNA